MDNQEIDLGGLPTTKVVESNSMDLGDLPVVKKKDGTIVSGPIPLPSPSVSPNFSQGEKMAKEGFNIPQSEIGKAVEKDKKVDGSTVAGLYNTLVGSISSFGGGFAYMSNVLGAPAGMPLNVRVANAQADRRKVADFIEKARSSASSKEFEQQRGKYDISDGVDFEDIKGLAFQTPKTLLDMGMGALTAGGSYFPQAINDNQKELEETGNADKLTPLQKVGYLFTQGAVQAALEKVGLDQVLGHTGLTKKVGQKIASEVVEEFVQKGVKATAKDIENAVLAKATKLVSKIKNVGVSAGKSFLVEGSTEGVQQGASDAIKTITNKIAKNDIFNQEDINKNFWKNILNNSFAGGVTGGLISGGIGGFNNTNKAIRSQIAAVQSPEDLAKLQTQIGEQVELGNITPQEAEAANIKAEDYAKIAAKIPAQVSQDDKYKIIGGIDQRNQLQTAMQTAMDDMSNLDESFKKQKEDEIALMQAKLNQVNDYIDGIVGGKQFEYKENKGEFYKVDSEGKETSITKQDYDIAKAVQEENKRKESQQQEQQKNGTDKRQEQFEVFSQLASSNPDFKFIESFDEFNKKIDSEGGEQYLKDLYNQSKLFVQTGDLGEVETNSEENFVNYLKPKKEVVKEIDEFDAINALTSEESKKVADFTAEGRIEEANKIVEDKLNELKNKSNTKTQEIKIQEPTEEQIVDDVKNKRFATFTYKSEEEVPEQFKDKISSTGENTLPDGTVEKIVRVTVPQSIADYELAKTQEVKPIELEQGVKVIEPKSPVSIPEEISNPIINKIKKGIQKLSDTAKVSVLKGKNFAKALDEAIKTGRVNLQSWGGFEKKGFEESPQWQKLIEDGSVKLNFDMKGLEGKPVVVINPDNMLTGAVITKNGKPIIDGNGGINFVTKFGDVWASSDNATANTLAKYINEARTKDLAAGGDGTVHVVVTKGDLSKSLTSHSGAKAAMKVLEYLVDKKYISLADFRKALTDVGKKYNIDFDGRLDAKSIQDDIAKKFFGVTDSTFSKRGFFVQDIIDHLAKNSKSAKDNISKIRELLNTEALPQSTERKTGDISFAKEGIIDAIGHLLSDNMTVGVKNSEAYATIEIKHPVEVVNLNKEEGGHESYPFHLRQIDENGNKVKPILNVLGKSQHVTDILNDANNQRVEKKGGAGKFGSNQIGMAKGFVKLAEEQPTGVNMMTDATGKVYGFEQNGKIVLNADLMNGNTPFHEAGHLWLSWAKENRTDLHDAGMDKIKNSAYLKDVKNNKVYQENASKLPKGEREAYFMSEALAKAIGDNGEKFVTQAQKSDFKKWIKDLWETIATNFGLRDMSAEDISNMTLDEFSKKVVADIVGPESQKTGKEEVKVGEKAPVEFSVEEIYKELPKAKNLRETAQKNLINSNFDKIVEQLIKNDKIQKKC